MLLLLLPSLLSLLLLLLLLPLLLMMMLLSLLPLHLLQFFCMSVIRGFVLRRTLRSSGAKFCYLLCVWFGFLRVLWLETSPIP